MRSSKNKDDPFISEFDMGLTDHLVEHLNDMDMITPEDYEMQKERIRVLNRPPAELELKELKDRLRAYRCWERGMTREEMEFQLAFQNRRSERLTRLREASDIAGFGFTEERLNTIVGDTKANKGTSFRREDFVLPRPVFLRLPAMENAWSAGSIPTLVLDRCLVIVDAEREWVFGEDRARNLPRFRFPREFCEALRDMEETGRVCWFRPEKKFKRVDAFLQRHFDENTGKAYAKLQVHAFWWQGRHGDEENPVRFTKSSSKVISNLKSGSFEPSSVAELLYQSNNNLEPVIEWDPHSRRKLVYRQKYERCHYLMRTKYKSKTDEEIEILTANRVKLEDFFHLHYDRLMGAPVASPVRRGKKKADDDDLDE
jgi:hypothetical protein